MHREPLAKNVNLYVIEKPDGFSFRPGQAVELSIDEEKWREDKHPFTITSLPDNLRLEFIIKSYPVTKNPRHDGMTEHLGRDVEVDDRVLFGDVWGAIENRGTGVFIAGGAGMTPFVAILRKLEQDKRIDGNRLFFSNRTEAEVFLHGEFARLLGRNAILTLTGEKHRNYESGRIDRAWLESRVDNFDQPFYLCGPPKMVEELSGTLEWLGANADSLVFEK
ncbi:hypothetical protein [Novipirellula rosea]|uniref:FAD-binding FR-type domain-containing protein n=1 Tax=Novipirellula rosea TaxID=1031540 RepID=A0ABP8NP08_9BACT